MIKKLFVLLLIAHCSLTYAQTIKTDVLVIGDGASGVAAAMQCARSKVKTILAERDTIPQLFEQNTGHPEPGLVTPGELSVIKANRNLSSGIWGEFRKRFREYHKGEKDLDTSYNSPLHYDSWSGSAILKKMMDTIKNQTVYTNTTFIAIKKDNDFWDVNIMQNGKAKMIKARVVIDATSKGSVVSFAGATHLSLDSVLRKAGANSYRTSIAMGDGLPRQHYNGNATSKENYPSFPAYCIPIKAVIAKGVDNLLITDALFPSGINANYLPGQFAMGQGAGAIAAYCAFFKTTTSNLRVRTIQGELLDFKGYLLPFADINTNDPDWRAVQQVCATGLLKGIQQVNGNDAQFLFRPDSSVNTAEVRPVLTEIYTRAFLWFNKERPGEKFTLGNLLSFISDYTLTDPQVLKFRLQKDWKTQFKFKSDFDVNRQITRREFAVLANKFLNPFARTVDLNGNLVN